MEAIQPEADRQGVLVFRTPEAVELSPEAKVDQYLAAHAELFEATKNAWKEVSDRQAEAVTLGHDLSQRIKDGDIEVPHLNREQKRKQGRQYRNFAQDPRSAFSIMARVGRDMLKTHLHELKDLDDTPDYRDSFTIYKEHIQEDRDELVKDIDKMKEEVAAVPGGQYIMPFAELSLGMSYAYEDGYFANGCVVRSVQNLLNESPDCVGPFIKKLQEEAARAESGTRQYPALLETLAIYISDHPKDNALTNAIITAAPNVRDFAPGFLEEVQAGTGNRKELLLAKNVMKSMVEIAEDVYGIDPTEFMAKYADKHKSWPTDLQQALAIYATGKVSGQLAGVKALLRPFYTPERSVHFNSNSPFKISGEGKVTVETKRQRQRRQGKNNNDYTSRKRGVGAVAAAHIELTALPERAKTPPISRFAVMRQHGASEKGVPRYRLEQVDSIEALIEVSNLSDCLSKHKGDKSLEVMIPLALKSLAEDPRDPRYTKGGKGLNYRLVDDVNSRTPRRARRFRPVHFPGVADDSVAASTRIIYDVHGKGEERTLIVYGIIPKEDLIDYGMTMPRRRW